MNVIFSGWPAAGGSSLAMATALLLRYKYLYAGGLLKFLAAEMYGSGDGKGQMKFERDNGVEWDNIWEAYAAWKMQNSDETLMEGMTAGFLVPGDHIFRVMVIADFETRVGRATGDGRLDPEQTIRERDKEVRQRWIDLFDVDVYDMDRINRDYQGIVDTSGMSLMEELEVVIDMLRRSMKFEDLDFAELTEEAQRINQIFEQEGKDGLKREMREYLLFLSSEDVLKEWNQQFEKEVDDLSPEFRQTVRKFK